MFNNILFVCIGNICRSPMAEGFFRKQFIKYKPNVNVASAGLHAVVGAPAVAEAQAIMTRVGIDIAAHKAKQIDNELVFGADIIFVMDSEQKQQIEFIFPHSRGRVFRLGKWSDFDIPDPYQCSLEVFENCFELIKQGWQDWQQRIT